MSSVGMMAATVQVPSGGAAAPAFRSLAYLAYAGRAVSPIGPPPTIVAGDILVITWTAYGNPTAATPTPPAGFTSLAGTWPYVVHHPSSSETLNMYVWWKIAGSSESGAYTVTHNTANCVASCCVYSNAHAAAPIDTAGTQNSGSGTTATGLSITTTQDNATVMWIGTDWGDASTNLVPPTSTTPVYTERLDVTLLYIADGVKSPAGATGNSSHGTNSAGSSPWGALVFALAPN